MATRKDQLDAFNFARRRMVANLVVPTATGSDEGAPRPVKTFASSIILSAIAVAAVAVLGVFKPSAPTGWQAGLAVDSSTGAAYITQNNQLHAVVNITSARLILGTKFQKFDVPDATLNGSGITIGSPVGILGAPEDVPPAANTNLTQWAFCQHEKEPDDQGVAGGPTYLEIGYWASPSTTVWSGTNGDGGIGSSTALVVHDSQDNVYLVDGDYKYEIGNDTTDKARVQALLAAVHNQTAFPTDETGYWVSDAWLSAFKTGSQITYPELEGGIGGPVAGSNQPGQKIGAYGQNEGGDNDSVQVSDGAMQLSTFAYNLYAANPQLAGVSNIQIPQSSLSENAINLANTAGAPNPSNEFASGTYGTDWPQLPPASLKTDTTDPSTQNICVGYNGTIMANDVPQLTTWTSAQLPFGSPSQQLGLTQTTSDSEATTVVVKPGYGVIAQRPSATQYLIEDSGFRYPLGASAAPNSTGSASGSGSGTSSQQTAKDLLGYGATIPEKVPAVWINLIQGGASLVPDLAGQTPETGN